MFTFKLLMNAKYTKIFKGSIIKIEGAPSLTAKHYSLNLFSCFDNSAISISGGNYLCNQGFYSLSGVPSGSTITWTLGPYLSQVSGQGTSSIYVQQNGNGFSSISAEITKSCKTITITREIEVGIPLEATYINNGTSYTMSTFNNVAPGQTNVKLSGETNNNYQWSLTSGNPLYWYTINNDDQEIVFELEPGSSASWRIDGTKTNCADVYRTVAFATGGYFISAYPNPVENTLVIDTEIPNNLDDENVRKVEGSYDVSIYDNQGFVVMEKQGLNKKSELSLHHLKKGLYILKIKHADGEIITQLQKN